MSEEIKRYDCTNGKAQHCYGCYQMEEKSNGDWVDAADYDAALSQLAALREELATITADRDAENGMKAKARMQRDKVTKRLADAERRNAAADIESAAKVLANCMDYPWEHMPENGRALMRKHAKDVIDAALNPNPEAASHDE